MTPSRSFARQRNTAFAACAALVLGLALGAAPASAASREHVGKRDFPVLAAQWWQWALAAPTATSPLLDTSGANCAVGQSGPLWFLAGPAGSGTVERTCSVPRRTQLFFPAVNAFYCADPGDSPMKKTQAYVRDQVAYATRATGVTATVDGRAVPRSKLRLERSVIFSLRLRAGNIFGAPAGTYEPCADAGYYVLVRHLSPGAHTLHFGGTESDGATTTAVDVTYHLTVRRR